MGVFKRAVLVLIKLIFILQLAACYYGPGGVDFQPPSEGCVKHHNGSACFYYVYCAGYIENNAHSYIISSRGYNSRQYSSQSNYDCTNYIQCNGNSYYKIYLTYKDNAPMNPTAQIPVKRDYNYYGDCSIYYLIVDLDLSGNEYNVIPNLTELNNLIFVNLSSNFLTVAKLYNPYPLQALNEIDLSHNTIASIEVDHSQHVYSSLRKLNMSHNYMVEIPDSIFDPFSLLETLDLSHNFIDTLSISAFEGVKKLIILFLSHNRIADINHSLFRFSELTILDLSYNRIEHLKFQDFEKLVKLETIDLSSNSIMTIDQCIFCSMNILSTVNLQHNKLTTISKETFSNASSLNTVDISYNNFNVLPRGLFKGKNIRVFAVNGNNLKDTLTKGTFEGLNLVTKLDLSYQNLITLEDYAFFGLENVRTLLLDNNNINSLSTNCFRALQNLITLDLSSNNITEFNINVEDLVNLNTIVLKNNFLSQISHSNFFGLNSLQFLDLTNNAISKFESNSFGSLRDLINFRISNNPLNGTLEEKTFEGLNSLPSLVLSFTQLTAIKNGSFIGMSQLKELNVSHSKINELEYNAFFQTGALEVIDLSYNELRSFSVNASHLTNIGVLLLNNNLLKAITESSFFGFARLTKISLAHNHITSVHMNAFYGQKDLENLDLSYNLDINFDVSIISNNKNLFNLRLSGIRNDIHFVHMKDTQLTTLEISYSGLKNVTKVNLKELDRLENLVLSNNEISKLEVGAFKNLIQLRQIDISNNKIYYIQPGIFKDSLHLNKLNISHNLLTSISYGMFRGLMYLSILDMSYNNLSSLEGERFYEVRSLSALIVDHNNIASINAEDFDGTSLSTLSIGENPLPCELLVNLKKTPPSFAITAIKFNEHANENVDGVTCNMNGFVFNNIKSNHSNFDGNEHLLIDIRELLVKIANKNTNDDHTVISENNGSDFKNFTDHVDKIVDKYGTNWSVLANLTSLLTAQSNTTNLLLTKILNALNRKLIATSTPFPVSKDNATNDLINYINKLKDELENTIAAEKDNILQEVEKKVSILQSQTFVKQHTEEISTHSPDAIVHDKLLAKNEEYNTTKSSMFTETCVALILGILVCLVLYKFYKSRMFVRARRSYSTRELPGAMESQNL